MVQAVRNPLQLLAILFFAVIQGFLLSCLYYGVGGEHFHIVWEKKGPHHIPVPHLRSDAMQVILNWLGLTFLAVSD